MRLKSWSGAGVIPLCVGRSGVFVGIDDSGKPAGGLLWAVRRPVRPALAGVRRPRRRDHYSDCVGRAYNIQRWRSHSMIGVGRCLVWVSKYHSFCPSASLSDRSCKWETVRLTEWKGKCWSLRLWFRRYLRLHLRQWLSVWSVVFIRYGQYSLMAWMCHQN